jgi:hypothetical protein
VRNTTFGAYESSEQVKLAKKFYLERILHRKGDIEEKDTSSIRRVFWPHYGGDPVKNIVASNKRKEKKRKKKEKTFALLLTL